MSTKKHKTRRWLALVTFGGILAGIFVFWYMVSFWIAFFS